MVLAAGYAPVSQPLPAATHAARLSLHAIQIPADLPHTAHKKTGPPKWACCYQGGWEYRDKGRYSRSFT